MTDYTVIANSDKKNLASVVIEYDVPAAGTNFAGIQWRTIVADIRTYTSQVGFTNNPVKQTDTGYIDTLDAGAKVEIPFTVEYDANLSNAQKASAIDNAVSARVGRFQTAFGNLYEFYGVERTV